MKDPLNPELTPYELLGIERGASMQERHEGYKRQLAADGDAAKLRVAVQKLRDPESAALIDFFEHDARFLASLGIAARDLEGNARQSTRQRLESLLKGWMSDARRTEAQGSQLAQTLFLLSYYSSCAPTTPAAERRTAWRRTIAYYGFLNANVPQVFAECGQEAIQRSLDTKLMDRHTADPAFGYDALRAMIPVEVRAGKTLKALGLGDGIGFGPLFAEHLDFQQILAHQIRQRLRAEPSNADLHFLAGVFSGHAGIHALRERKDFKGALAAIQRLPQAERVSEHVVQLQAEVLFELGETLASVATAGMEAQVLQHWEQALQATEDAAFAAKVRTHLEEFAIRRAVELERHNRETAIEFLNRARASTDTAKLRSLQVDAMRRRAMELGEQGRVLEAQRLLAATNDLVRPAPRPREPRPQRVVAPPTPAAARPPPIAEALDPVSAARQLRTSGQSGLAVQLLEQLIPRLPSSQQAAAKQELAVCLVARARELLRAPESPASLREAYEKLMKARQLEPDNPEVLTALAEARLPLPARPDPRPVFRPPPAVPAEPAKPESLPTPAPARSPSTSASRLRNPAHVFALVSMVAIAVSGGRWLVSAEDPWVVEVRHQYPLVTYLKPLLEVWIPRVLMGWMGIWLLSVARLGWLSTLAQAVNGVLQHPFVVRWQDKHPLGRLVEYVTLAGVASIAFVCGTAAWNYLQAKPDVTVVSAAKAAPAKQSRLGKPGSLKLGKSDGKLDVTRSLSDLSSTPKAVAAKRAGELTEKRSELKGRDKRAAGFVLAATLERAGEKVRARKLYKELALGSDAYARSAAFRLADLAAGKPPEEVAYAKLASNEESGWYWLDESWHEKTQTLALAQRRLEARADRSVVKLLSAIRERAPVPAESAYWFVFGVLIVAFKLLQLPLTVHSTKMTTRLETHRAEFERIQQNHADDLQARNAAMTQFYRRHGINLGSGCLVALSELALVVWVLLELGHFAPQWTMDGSRFLWLEDITRWDPAVAGAWVVCQIWLSQGVNPVVQQTPSLGGRLFLAALFPLVVAAVAWYYAVPAFIFIFLTLLSLTSVALRGVLRRIFLISTPVPRYG